MTSAKKYCECEYTHLVIFKFVTLLFYFSIYKQKKINLIKNNSRIVDRFSCECDLNERFLGASRFRAKLTFEIK
jgi:hypothetical protein